MQNRIKIFVSIVAVVLMMLAVYALSTHHEGKPVTIPEQEKIVVVSPHPTQFIIPLIQEFENETGIKVEIQSLGTSAAIDAIVNDDNIDVLWGGSILAVGPYLDNFAEYESLNKAVYKEKFKGFDNRYSSFSDLPSVLIVNTDIVGNIEIKGYEDLLDGRLKGKIAYADPSSSSSSFEHLVNMLYAMGKGDPEKGWEYIGKFTANLDGKLLQSSSEVYEGVANGEYIVGLTFEEAAVTMLKNDKHIGIIYMEEGVVSTPDAICINKNSNRQKNAKRFIDFMTSKNAQQFMAGELGRRSVRKDVEVSELVVHDDEINNIEVDKDIVISSKEIWDEKFKEIYKEHEDD